MNNADSVSAVFGLLLGLAVHHQPVMPATVMTMTAEAAPSGPVVAIDKAKAAAAAESRRARESDAEAARVFANDGSGGGSQSAAPAAPSTAGAAHAAAPSTAGAATLASRGPADSGSAAASAPNAGAANEKYDPAAHRDPFRPPSFTSTVADKSSPRTPLEGYEIGQLKLVGIVREGGSVRAMVEDSAGLGYIVTTGTPIGTSGGVVRTIDERRVRIEEMTTNFYGEKQAKEVVMELPQEDRSP